MHELSTAQHPLEDFTRSGMIPHIWCNGCGNGIILGEFARAIDELNFDRDKIVVVSGIGCIGRISGYTNTDSFHTTHGRPLAFAVGVKAVRPDLKPVVISGDGDLFAIGGNHFIHAARRNVDIAVICSNNFNYGMTGGQSGPTTPIGAFTTTSRYGNIEHPFNLVHLAAASGAIYVARWTAIHVKRIRESMKKAITKKGFSFVEIITPCPEEYGRRNKIADPIRGMKWLREVSEVRSKIDPIDAVAGPEKIIVGEFVDIEKPEFSDLLWDQNRSIAAGLDKAGRRTNVAL
jgi:2-oxoglutarate ferredoxin oxidoreductase subunit beta